MSRTSELGIEAPADPMVLLAFDSPAAGAPLAALYHAEQMRTCLVSTALEAVRLVEDGIPDLVVLGVRLPDLDGIKVCAILKTNARTHLVPVILVGHGDDEPTRTACLKAGADHYFVAPVPPPELRVRSHSLLRTRGLIRELEERRATLRLRADWVRFLVHDLRGPLTSVLANLDYVQGQLEGSDGHREEVDALGDSRYEVKRMSAMVQDLLDVDRFDGGRLTLRPVAIDVGPLLAALERDLRWISETRGTEIRYHTEPELTVWADPLLLERVLENLCRNALRFSPRDRPVDIHLASGPDEVTVAVTNRGPAIHPANRDQIFEPYVRLHDHATAPGVGLGLAFCRLAVEAHGGRIWVEDPAGGGVTFAFAMPRRPPPR